MILSCKGRARIHNKNSRPPLVKLSGPVKSTDPRLWSGGLLVFNPTLRGGLNSDAFVPSCRSGADERFDSCKGGVVIGVLAHFGHVFGVGDLAAAVHHE